MEKTWVVLRIPGFYARVERLSLTDRDPRPIIVLTGEGSRALVLSVEYGKSARLHPGMRIEAAPQAEYQFVQANPAKYSDMERRCLEALGWSLPEVERFRAGVFASCWEGGTRFLTKAIDEAEQRLRGMGLTGGWGIGPEAAVTEIASQVASEGERVAVSRGKVRAFLAPLPLRLLHDLSIHQLDLLREMGIRTFGDLALLPSEALKRLFGREGPGLIDIAVSGRRPETDSTWRGRQRLGEDAADAKSVRGAVSHLIATGSHMLSEGGQQPGWLQLTLLYSDARATSGVVRRAGREHEGHWQQAALDLMEKLWTRRVRIAEVRLTLHPESATSSQLHLFVPAQRMERESHLRDAMNRLRKRWGFRAVNFAPSVCQPNREAG